MTGNILIPAIRKHSLIENSSYTEDPLSKVALSVALIFKTRGISEHNRVCMYLCWKLQVEL